MTETLIVGLEVHVQLLTNTKIFCGCINRFNPDAPNTQTCPVCLGHPGSLPVMNEEAFRLSLITAIALNCEIAPFTKWDRKQYFYPDLPKGYQISQFDLPFSHDGWLEATSEDGTRRKIRINRAHLEEDAGKNIHDESGRGNDSQVDLNRTGTPLLEIVSEPDFRSAAEAKSYLEELHLLLTFLGVSDCNMQEGSLRCDANVNLHYGEGDDKIATPIVEVKNLNSFRAVEAAIEFEAARQKRIYAETGRKLGDPGVMKETRGWDANRNATFGQRGKEEASDYRYFPDPDLVPVTVTAERVEEIRAALPEPPSIRRQRFESEFGLSAYDADVIMNQGKDVADYYETVVASSGVLVSGTASVTISPDSTTHSQKIGVNEDGERIIPLSVSDKISLSQNAKASSNLVTQEVLREMKERAVTIEDFPISPTVSGAIIQRVVDKKITKKGVSEVFSALLEESDENVVEPTGGAVGSGIAEINVVRVDEIISERGLEVVSDTGALEEAVKAAIAESPKAVEDFKAGKQQAVGAIIGKVMRLAKGADAKTVRELIIKTLQEM